MKKKLLFIMENEKLSLLLFIISFISFLISAIVRQCNCGNVSMYNIIWLLISMFAVMILGGIIVWQEIWIEV